MSISYFSLRNRLTCICYCLFILLLGQNSSQSFWSSININAFLFLCQELDYECMANLFLNSRKLRDVLTISKYHLFNYSSKYFGFNGQIWKKVSHIIQYSSDAFIALISELGSTRSSDKIENFIWVWLNCQNQEYRQIHWPYPI